MPRSPADSPITAGLTMIGLGVLLRWARPRALDMPDRLHDGDFGGRGLDGAARKTRDGVAEVLPDNLSDGLARSLMIFGAGLILLRALDQTMDDDDALF